MQKSQRGKAGRQPRSVYLEIGFWMKAGVIHVTAHDPEGKKFHIAVRNDGSKPSGHPMLYRELSKCLEEMGVETE